MTADAAREGAAPLELTILMPCLNEALTLATCLEKARGFLNRTGIAGELLVADNGSTDGSQAIARAHGARVVDVPIRGYGAALRAGMADAAGTYVIFGDADDSYDFSRLEPFVHALRGGADVVIGNRFQGGIGPGAMPFLHRYLGNPVLSFLGRLFFSIPIGDFHCGLRACRVAAMRGLLLQTTGMEFASEMIVAGALHGLRFAEVPTTLSKDGRDRPPHLRTWRDGWRHLRFLLLFSPRWLFLYPGAVAFGIGAALLLALFATPIRIAGVTLDVHTMLYAGALTVIGAQLVFYAIFAKTFVIQSGLHPPDERMTRLWRHFTLETGLAASLAVIVAGLVLGIRALLAWQDRAFGALEVDQTLRLVIPSVVLLILGVQGILHSFFLSILGLQRRTELR